MNKTDFVVLITEPTPFGFNDLKIAVETIKGLNKPFGVVINKYGIGNNEVEKYCTDNEIHILATIPYDKEIAELYSNGELVYKKIKSVDDSLKILVSNINKIIENE